MTKVPLAESRRLIVMEVKVFGVHGEEGQEEDDEVQGDVKGEVEVNQGRRHMDGMRMEWQTLNGLEPCGV